MFCIYLEESTPKAASKAHADRNAANPDMSAESTSAETQQIVRQEVGARWNKLSEQDLSALKDRDDLVREVVSRYGVEKSEAQRDVDSLLKGRPISCGPYTAMSGDPPARPV
jgi:hypothetical protein